MDFTPHLPIKKKPSHMSNFYWGRNNKKTQGHFQPMDPVGKAKIERTTVTRHPPQTYYTDTPHATGRKNLTSGNLWKRSFSFYIKGF